MKLIQTSLGRLLALASLGASLGLTLSHADAATPPTRYTIDAAEGTVRDNRTGLTWTRNVDATMHTWEAAKRYCQQLPLAGGGFRLPRIYELLTLVDPTRNRPAIDGDAFPGTPAAWFWSSTPSVDPITPGKAWYLDFIYGGCNSYPATEPMFARCVR